MIGRRSRTTASTSSTISFTGNQVPTYPNTFATDPHGERRFRKPTIFVFDPDFQNPRPAGQRGGPTGALTNDIGIARSPTLYVKALTSRASTDITWARRPSSQVPITGETARRMVKTYATIRPYHETLVAGHPVFQSSVAIVSRIQRSDPHTQIVKRFSHNWPGRVPSRTTYGKEGHGYEARRDGGSSRGVRTDKKIHSGPPRDFGSGTTTIRMRSRRPGTAWFCRSCGTWAEHGSGSRVAHGSGWTPVGGCRRAERASRHSASRQRRF
jgi:hypothetical protein